MILNSLLFGEDKMVAEWVADKMDLVSRGFEKSTAIGIMNKEGSRMIAGVVYSEYYPEHKTIQMSIASISPMWARKETIRRLLVYPFEQLGVFKIIITTAIDNIKSLKVTDHIGFKREAVLAHQFGYKKHAVISRMLKTDFDKLYGV